MNGEAAPSVAMSSLSEIAKCLGSIQNDLETLANFRTSTELEIADLKTRVAGNADYIHDMSSEVNDNKHGLNIVGQQSDSVLKQLNDSNSLMAFDVQINSLTQLANTKDITATCSNLAVFGLIGDSASLKDQFGLIFGPLMVPGGLLSQSYIKSMETFELSRTSTPTSPKAVVISAKNPESSIKIISKMQTMLREAIDSHGGRKAESNPYRSANVNAFYEKSVMPLRSVLLKKATFLKERFTWMKHIRVQLERRQFRLALVVTPSDQLRDSLKRKNLLPVAELKVGLSIESISNFDDLPWKKMRDSQDANGHSAPLPRDVPDPAVTPFVADSINDEINLTTPAAPAVPVNMDTGHDFLPPTLPVLPPHIVLADGAVGGHTAETPPSSPLPDETKHSKSIRGRSRSMIRRDNWAIEPSPKRVRSSSSSRSNVSDPPNQTRKKPQTPLLKPTADSGMPPPPAPSTPTTAPGPTIRTPPTTNSTRGAKPKLPGPLTASATQRSASLSSKLPIGRT